VTREWSTKDLLGHLGALGSKAPAEQVRELWAGHVVSEERGNLGRG